MCSVPKSGGNTACTAPFSGGARALAWDGALYFTAHPGGLVRTADVTTGLTTLTDKVSGLNMWVDEASVWWLSGEGDLYRVDK